jgi:putative acetyltransferase
MKPTHRLAMPADAVRLFELRRRSILTLAPREMSRPDAETWAATLNVAGMEQKIRELEIWVAEVDGVIAGWGAIHGNRLEGLYTDPEFVCQGIATGLLELLEALMRQRGIAAVSSQASANAERFYFRRGYEPIADRTLKQGQPMRKRLR